METVYPCMLTLGVEDNMLIGQSFAQGSCKWSPGFVEGLVVEMWTSIAVRVSQQVAPLKVVCFESGKESLSYIGH